MKSGAGGKLSLLCKSSTEIQNWIELWVNRGVSTYSDFMIQEYLPGKNIAFDSLWHNGKFIASYTRERLEYPFKHISPSGITGTPTVSRIIKDEKINEISKQAILSVDPKPHGSYAVDLKGDVNGHPNITEIDSKTKLQGYTLKKYKRLPIYKLLKSTGPKHNPLYKVGVKIKNSKVHIGNGKSIKNAEQNAAESLTAFLGL